MNLKYKLTHLSSGGRTMTEMLGVLAIVGILSIGALAGYRYAMDKQRANVTINDINLRGVDLIIQASRNIPLNLEEWSTTSTAGYTFGTPEYADDGFVKLSVSGLPERVCDMVVDGLSSQFDMDINGEEIATGATCGDDNIITVYFDAAGSTGTDDCGGCPGVQECVSGVCTCTNGGTGENCTCNGTICDECQKCQDGACVNKPNYALCSTGYCDNGECRPSKCSADKPLMNKNGFCYSCDETSRVWVSGVTENCTVCPNRVVNNNYCILPICPGNQPLRDTVGGCYSCDTTSGVYVEGVEGNCAVCENRVLDGIRYCRLKCPADKPLMDYHGTCHSCYEAGSVYVSGITENCAVCDNRVTNGSYCALPCPEDKPLMDEYGTCHSCNELLGVYVSGVMENCSVCSNRKINDYGSTCALSVCPPEAPLQGSDGSCYSCDDTRDSVVVEFVEENCAVCPDWVLDGFFCVSPSDTTTATETTSVSGTTTTTTAMEPETTTARR